MKKISLGILIIFSFISASAQQSENSKHGGNNFMYRAGLSISKFRGVITSDETKLQSESTVGGYLGAVFNIDIHNTLSIQPGITLGTKGGTIYTPTNVTYISTYYTGPAQKEVTREERFLYLALLI